MKEKKTKIICTISDRNCSVEFIKDLYEQGMNVVRINSAHTTLESSLPIVENTRKVSDKIAILVDTKGPEIRITHMGAEGGFDVKEGDEVIFENNPLGISGNGLLYTNYNNFIEEVPVGARILIDDGEISLTVVKKNSIRLYCKANNNGVIEGRKSINIPNVTVNLPSVSDRDKEYIMWAIENNLDFIAHSFVRDKEDLVEIQKILDKNNSHLKIISKIENQEGVDNLDEILSNCYGVMVARGDLGVEIEYQKIPVIQKEITERCQERKKPVIIATQMLHSMIENPRPTRAEVTDVANAIYQGTDAVMLSGETANGKYAKEAVATMANIAIETEKKLKTNFDLELKDVTHPVAAVLSCQLVSATRKLPIKAMVFDTRTGRTGRYLSAFRPRTPIYAMCYSPHVMRELALSFGVHAYYMDPTQSKDEFIRSSINKLLSDKRFKKENMIGVVGGSFGPSAGATFMEICPAGLMVIPAELR
ncbi:MAG: pyruvate kinase [Bacteroidales bacterium]|nr:pyruvate kinase [Bacteroidales bacterium]MDD4656445.1 pyruvate kinase [Bacteroidales bacterium]